ncbi:ZIP family metal transporter [Riemerella columbipharyngis]|uniref:ZIP Zinc transporter n=1 Tax=Riemerella columbipharyngis TaxID=1071918 RepID=A0A1G6ZST8_9FLAO|nr:ZIP family metal transporter [Riemerella columbipharyngis]SDE04626.1 ZIP Zinc transporter [Riemerella columbipharyngis]
MITALLILVVCLGALVGRLLGTNRGFAKKLLVLSAGFIITVCVCEIFPAVYENGGPNIGIWVIAGVLLQLILENITKGLEHGHFHYSKDNNVLIPTALMFGMFVHAFIEGMPLAGSTTIRLPYLLGILVHKFPISFILGAYLYTSKMPKFYAMALIGAFAAASPLGFFFGNYINGRYESYLLALVEGIFLHISSVIIFESNKNHKMDFQKIFLVLMGGGVALLGHLFHSH